MPAFNVKNFNMISASMINWMANNQDVITDFNPGAVCRTILEAVALEMEEFYFRTYEGLGSGIAEAIYTAFDFPRLPPTRATGLLKFSRNSPAQTTIDINFGMKVKTPDGKEYEVVDRGTQISGPAPFAIDEIKNSGYIDLKQAEGNQTAFFPNSVSFTFTGTTLNVGVSYTTPTVGVASAYVDTGGAIFKTRIYVVEPLQDETPASGIATRIYTEVSNVNAQAVSYGSGYNKPAGSVTQFVTPIQDVQQVTNITPMSGGSDLESNNQRKSRFNLFIQSLARGTLPALEFAALSVPGVISARAVDNMPVYVLTYESWPNVNVIDETQKVNLPYEQEFSMLQGTTADVVIAADMQFDIVYVDLSQVGNVGGDGTWMYWSASLNDWNPIPALAITDGTNKFKSSGSIQLDLSVAGIGGDWGNITFTEGNDEWGAKGKVLFPIRFNETTAYTTEPKCIQMFIKPVPGEVYIYATQDNRVLTPDVKNQIYKTVDGYLEILSGKLIDGYRSGGVRVQVKEPVERNITVNVLIRVAGNYDRNTVKTSAEQALANFTSGFGLGQSIYKGEITQYLMNLHDEAIVDVDILQLGNTTAPLVGDAIASPNQVFLIRTEDITVSVV